MISLSRRQFSALLTAGGLGHTIATSAESPRPATDPLIGAHYYTWYGPDNHWDSGYVGTPILGEYDSSASKVIQQHIDWATTHDITWFNITWWGPESYSGRVLERNVAPQLADSPVEFSILYEPKGRLEYDDGRVDFDQEKNRTRLAEDVAHFESVYTDNQNYLHIDGRPVLYVYVSNTFGGDVVGAFHEAQKHAGEEFYIIGDFGATAQVPNLEVYDAVSPYNMYNPDAVGDGFETYVDTQYRRWNLLARDFDFTLIPSIVPGFDNTEAVWASDDLPILERTPDRYRKQCEIARSHMDPDQPIALVTSFNEWHEYTSIEPDENFETTYLEMTRESLARGEIGGGVEGLVPLRFYWETYVEESSVNPDIPPERGRELTIAVTQLNFVSGDGQYVREYDIGGSPEPIFTEGASRKESHKDLTWRWLTSGERMQTRLYIPQTVAESTQRLEVEARAAEPGFEFQVSLGEATEPTTLSIPDHWATRQFDLAGQQTPTSTETATSSSNTASTAEPVPDFY